MGKLDINYNGLSSWGSKLNLRSPLSPSIMQIFLNEFAAETVAILQDFIVENGLNKSLIG